MNCGDTAKAIMRFEKMLPPSETIPIIVSRIFKHFVIIGSMTNAPENYHLNDLIIIIYTNLY